MYSLNNHTGIKELYTTPPNEREENMKECVPCLPVEDFQRCTQKERCHLCNLKLFVCVGYSQERRLDCCLLTARPCIEAWLIDKCVLRPNKKVAEPGSHSPVG